MANSLIVLMLSIGLFSGIASGIFGIGGGIIIARINLIMPSDLPIVKTTMLLLTRRL